MLLSKASCFLNQESVFSLPNFSESQMLSPGTGSKEYIYVKDTMT